MIKIKNIVGVLVVVLLTLCSCTTDTIEQNLMLKKIVEVSVDGTSANTLLAYDGNKILNIDNGTASFEFYYTGDLISKRIEVNKSTSHKNTLEYSYLDGQLNKITSSDNYVVNYIHATDGSVTYEKLTKDANNLPVKIYHGKLTFQNGNLIKDEKTFDNVGSGVLSQTTNNFVYDTKYNPLATIVGFSKLLDFQELVSVNNTTISTVSSSLKNKDDDQIISSIKRTDSQLQYNSSGYPTEIISEKTLFGDSSSKHVKSQLFYN